MTITVNSIRRRRKPKSTRVESAVGMCAGKAVEMLAAKHNVSESEIARHILEKHPKLLDQFNQLMVTGIAAAMKTDELLNAQPR